MDRKTLTLLIGNLVLTNLELTELTQELQKSLESLVPKETLGPVSSPSSAEAAVETEASSPPGSPSAG